MRRLTVKAKYGYEFTHEKIPLLFLKLISSELNKPSNINIINYINDNYKLTKPQLINLVRNNLQISSYVDNVVIGFNPVKIKEELIDSKMHITYLSTILNFINYGNLQVKGSNTLNKIIDYIESNIDILYKLYKTRRGSRIWQ